MITISGGEVLKQNGSSITYKLKCSRCGNIESSEATITIMKGVTEVTAKRCSNCGNNQIVKMKFSNEQ